MLMRWWAPLLNLPGFPATTAFGEAGWRAYITSIEEGHQ